MTIATIQLNNAKDISDVSSLFNKQKYDIDVACGKYLIDGKSVIGLFMFLQMPITIYGTCCISDGEDLRNKLIKWSVD